MNEICINVLYPWTDIQITHRFWFEQLNCGHMILKLQHQYWNCSPSSFKIVHSDYNSIFLVRMAFYCSARLQKSSVPTVCVTFLTNLSFQSLVSYSILNCKCSFRQSNHELWRAEKSIVSDAFEGDINLFYYAEGSPIRKLCEFRRLQIVWRRNIGQRTWCDNKTHSNHSTDGFIGRPKVPGPILSWNLHINDVLLCFVCRFTQN